MLQFLLFLLYSIYSIRKIAQLKANPARVRLPAGGFHNRLWPPCSQCASHDGSMEVSKAGSLGPVLSSPVLPLPCPYPPPLKVAPFYQTSRGSFRNSGPQAPLKSVLHSNNKGQQARAVSRIHSKVHLTPPTVREIEGIEPLLFPVCIFPLI